MSHEANEIAFLALVAAIQLLSLIINQQLARRQHKRNLKAISTQIANSLRPPPERDDTPTDPRG